MLRITAPDISPELAWIVSVVFKDFLGIEYSLCAGDEKGFEITHESGRIEMPDRFFAACKGAWLQASTLPDAPLRVLDIGEVGDVAAVVSGYIPIIYGETEKAITLGPEYIYLPIDIFGAAFVMLSRYEEAVVPVRDMHGRFPATASIAWLHGLCGRPIIDEYVGVLAACIRRLWPRMEIRQSQFRTVVSCDVDHPYHASARSLSRLVRRSAGEFLRKRSLGDAVRPVRNYIASRSGDWKHDPYFHTVDWMMDVNERSGNIVAFYFIPEVSDPVFDGDCSITDSAVREMLRRIAGRGHEIGIHPGYRACEGEANVAALRDRLEGVLAQEGVTREVAGGRQHYLRWTTRTPRQWDAAQLEYDSTLGYAECGGFRCGTCREYPMYDLHARHPLMTRQRPLVCMEVAVIDALGMGYTDDAFDAMFRLKQAARCVGGNFTLLWHNSSLETQLAREMYCHLIE